MKQTTLPLHVLRSDFFAKVVVVAIICGHDLNTKTNNAFTIKFKIGESLKKEQKMLFGEMTYKIITIYRKCLYDMYK